MTRENPVFLLLPSPLQGGTADSLRGDDDLIPYGKPASELGMANGCITCGDHVAVSVAARAQSMTLVNANHLGVVSMQNGTNMWWTQNKRQIKDTAWSCHSCQSTQRAQTEIPMKRSIRSPGTMAHAASSLPRISGWLHLHDRGRCAHQMAPNSASGLSDSGNDNGFASFAFCVVWRSAACGVEEWHSFPV